MDEADKDELTSHSYFNNSQLQAILRLFLRLYFPLELQVFTQNP